MTTFLVCQLKDSPNNNAQHEPELLGKDELERGGGM
jgi:hypothetical protein